MDGSGHGGSAALTTRAFVLPPIPHRTHDLYSLQEPAHAHSAEARAAEVLCTAPVTRLLVASACTMYTVQYRTCVPQSELAYAVQYAMDMAYAMAVGVAVGYCRVIGQRPFSTFDTCSAL
eukprot:7182236-Prymnesium_polylepis.2